jgi:hypothetical protein
MSYRSHKDYDLEDDLADHGSMSLAGIIKLQSDRRKGNKFWRPMQASDLGESHLDGTDQPHDDSSQQNHQAMGNSAIQLKTDSGGRHQHKEHYLAGNYLAEASRAQLFGTLPDPIQLSKQTGEFDGQVVFIGHPNRDVSAHQWSMPSFQWISIGRYSNFRGKIEGSLASDRLRGIDKPHDTLEYFKLAAENRQTLVTDNGSLDQSTTLTHRGFDLGPDNAVSSQIRRDAPAVSFYNTAQIQGRTGLSLPRAASAMFTKAVLEDPFVTAANVFSSQPLGSKRISDDWKHSTGSLDLAYRFPSQTIVAMSNATSNLYGQLRSGIFSGEGAECFATNVSSGSSPQEVALSKDAATQHGIIAANISSPQQRLPVSAILQRSLARSQHLEHIEASLPTSPEYEEPNSSVTRTTKAPVSRHPALSRSAAPLVYTNSALSATAIPFARPTTTATAPRASESNVGLVRYMTSGLRYSDPDGLRATQRYEVVNGLNQQAPTPQNFKGPFFTESKPTAHDPTVALTVRVSDEEELANWFRDGHRPARQKEYAKSLVAAAEAGDKIRRFGTVDETYSKEKSDPYANTVAFVRLYENLSEYAEEGRSGTDRSYFTRRWESARPQAQGVAFDKGAGYFSMGNVHSRWPKSPGFVPSDRSFWV